MSRRHRESKPGFSLFPFLEMLLSTLGVMTLLLAVVAYRAKNHIGQPQSMTAEQAAEHEILTLRVEQLTEQRDKTQQDLRERQLELGHLEQSRDQTRAQLTELIRAKDELDQAAALSAKERAQLQFELDRKQGELARKRVELEDHRRQQSNRAPSYAIVPYEGPNGTRRVPVYLECRSDRIVLQPEGIAFKEDDFAGPMGPGNPLATAVRAVRQHLNERIAENEEPYPLLLVRPDGIDAYWAARVALQSWGEDFGYELIDEDWQLAFPKPDVELASRVEEAIEAAREQQHLLAQLAPRSGGRSNRVYRANPTGGGIIAAGDSGHDHYGGRARPSFGNRRGGSAAGVGDDERGEALARAETDRRRRGGEIGADGGLFPPEATMSGRGGAAQYPGQGDEYGSGAAGASEDESRQSNSFGAAGDGDFASQQGGGSRPGSGGAEANGSQSSRAGSTSGGAGSPGASGADGPSLGTSPLDTPGQAHGPGSPGGKPGGMPYYSATPHLESMARKRGKNWGVPEAARGAAPLSRPIVVECHQNSLAIVSDDGSGRRRDVPLAGETEDAVDELIGAVWKHIDHWGIAGNGLYWHPILVLDVLPTGEARASDLESLLADSGIEVRRRQTKIVGAPPATNR